MIIEYHRPSTIETALDLLARTSPPTYPLAGGTVLSKRKDGDFAVVDIQDLQIHHIEQVDGQIRIGAGVSIQQMVDSPLLPDGLRKAARQEASYNLRQMATVGGTLAAGNASSILLTVLSALSVQVQLAGSTETYPVEKILTDRSNFLKGKLITVVILPQLLRFAFEKISKTPADQSQIMVCVSVQADGSTLASLGGVGALPLMIRGADLKQAMNSACREKSPYLQEMAGVLLDRCLLQVRN